MDNLLDDENVEDFEGYDHEDILDDEIEQNDAWEVINKYFDCKGLVGQQLDSFDVFIRSTIQEMIDDNGDISVTSENQFRGNNTKQVNTYRCNLHSLYKFYN